MSGTLNRYDAQSVLNIGVKEQQNILNGLPSIIQLCLQVLPNPGCLEKLQSDDKNQNLELIPESKNRAKNVISIIKTSTYDKKDVPFKEKKRQPIVAKEQGIAAITA